MRDHRVIVSNYAPPVRVGVQKLNSRPGFECRLLKTINIRPMPLQCMLHYRIGFNVPRTEVAVCQVSAWQSATLLPISCKSLQPVPAWVEGPVSPARQSSSGGVTMPYARKVGCQNW